MKFISPIILAFVCLMFLPVTHGFAKEGGIANYKKPMPEFEPLSDEVLDEQTEWYQVTPFNDKALAFKMRVPKGWQKIEDVNTSKYELNTKVFGEIARIYSPPKIDKRSIIRIQAVQLEYKLTAEQWLLKYLLSQGYSIEAFKTHDDGRAEAVVVHVIKDTQNAIRSVVQVNGKRVLLVQYYLPIGDWEQEKQLQMEVVQSFEILNPIQENVENMLSYQFLDIASIEYPESWELKAKPVRSVDRMGVELINIFSQKEEDKILITSIAGKIEIKLVSLYAIENLEEEIETQKSYFEQSGLKLGDLIELKDRIKTKTDFKFQGIDVFKASDDKDLLVDYELWLGTFALGEYIYFVSLLTPSRDQDFFTWARNTETYKVVIDHLSTQVKDKAP